MLQSFSDYGGPDEIQLGDGKTLNISHTGHTYIPTTIWPLLLPDVLCVPKLERNLISISQLCKTNNVFVEFFYSHFLMKDQFTGVPLMQGRNDHDVYLLRHT